jgi:hypothetical protein
MRPNGQNYRRKNVCPLLTSRYNIKSIRKESLGELTEGKHYMLVNSMKPIEDTTNHAQTTATTVPEIKYAAAIQSPESMHDSSHPVPHFKLTLSGPCLTTNCCTATLVPDSSS